MHLQEEDYRFQRDRLEVTNKKGHATWHTSASTNTSELKIAFSFARQGVLRFLTERYPVRLIVPVYIKKAYDSLTHEVIFNCLKKQEIMDKPFNFIQKLSKGECICHKNGRILELGQNK